MRIIHLFFLAALLTLFTGTNSAGQLTQSVRGTVTDAESKRPIADVVVTLLSADSLRAVTDTAGRFRFPAVPVGRQTFVYAAPGFEPTAAADAMVISGKETELSVVMKESLNSLSEVTVRSSRAGKPLNEFAAVSARSFSPEETRRYAASFADPARMVMNFPGVSNNGDMDNSIVVRGNSPRGVLWRLEGIEIPTPNHFSDLGNSGGPISMLNAATLGTSDFYTGAFAPEIGNALSGAFDLSFRNGNTTRAEHAVQIGAMGLEAATEGPFRKGGTSSYLVNYRYSTVALLERFTGLDGILPLYQDAAFKLHFPTRKCGTFSVFGLGGYNSASRKVDADSTKWNDDNENIGYLEKSYLGVAGISHQYFVGKDAYLKTILSLSHDGTANIADTLNPGDGYRAQEIERQNYSNTALRASLAYNQKLSARHTMRAGIIAQHWKYGYGYRYFDGSEKVWKSVLGDTGSTQYYQGYAQ